MFLHAFALVFVALVLSWAATIYFGHEVLIALGLIRTEAKIVAKKLGQLELPMLLVRLKAQAGAFLRAWAANRSVYRLRARRGYDWLLL